MRCETSLCTPPLVCICLFTFRESASVSLSFFNYEIRVFACSYHCGSCKNIDDCRLRRRRVRVNKCAWGVRWTGFSMIFSSRANRHTLRINFVRPLLNLSLKCHEGGEISNVLHDVVLQSTQCGSRRSIWLATSNRMRTNALYQCSRPCRY